MQQFAFAAFNGIASGMVIFLVAAGVTLIFGILKILNFSHAAFFMLGAYIAYSAFGHGTLTIASLLTGGLIAGLTVGACGFLVDRFILTRLRGIDEHYVLIATFALLMALTGIIKLIWGLDYYSVPPPPSLSGSFVVGRIFLPRFSLFVIVVGILLFAALDIGLHRLWIGKVLRSVVSDSWILGLLGYNVSIIYTVTVMLAFFLAGAAGGILLPNQSLSPNLAENYVLLGFVTCIIGGLGNVRGAFIAALLLGLTDNISIVLLHGFPGLSVYVAMVLALLLRPQGLFGTSTDSLSLGSSLKALIGSQRKTLPAMIPPAAAPLWPAGIKADLRASVQERGLTFRILGVLIAAGIFFLPSWADPGVVFLAGMTLIQALFALSWHFLFGYAGVVSFGHAAFYAIGAYGVGIGVKSSQLPFLFLVLMAGVAGAVVAAIVGALALKRTSGIYLGVLTMALAEICRLAIGYSEILGREDGLSAIPRPVIELGFVRFDLAPEANYYRFLFFAAVLLGGCLWWLAHGRFGRTLRSVKQDPERASFIGIDIASYRWRAFVVSGAVAAIAGGISAPWAQIVTPDAANLVMSTAPMLNTLLGGANSFWGPIIGATSFAAIGYSTRELAGLYEVLVGSVLLVVILVAPSGIIGFLHRLEGTVSSDNAARFSGLTRRLLIRKKRYDVTH